MLSCIPSGRLATRAAGGACAALAALLLLLTAAPASAQWFQGWSNPWWGQQQQPRRSYRSNRSYHHYHQERRAAQPQPQSQQDADYSKAPASPPRKAETPPQMNVLVVGDAMADWLGYGLELSFTESPEMGVLRRARTSSGLILQDGRSDPRGEHPDWPKAAKDILDADKPDFIVMMIGLNDRRQIRELRPPRAAIVKPQGQQNPSAPEGATPPNAAVGSEDNRGQPQPEGNSQTQAATDKRDGKENEAARWRGELQDFRSEKWTEAYIKRIDETIAAMKSKGVPVFWVGLPPVRGSRSMADFGFLNDLYRSRAEKAGIIYVDVWDGFADESGHYAQYGPDVEGQNRRLRSSDGTYFTEAGARKLAHFLERELQRWMTARAAPVAAPLDEPGTPKAADAKENPAAPAGNQRPLAGPVISLSGVRNSENDDTLIGGAKSRSEAAVVDALATKVLVKGDPVAPPAGRADDFSWPRRDIANTGTDPSVVVATLPMTPMKEEQRAAVAAPEPAAAPAPTSPAAPAATSPTRQQQPPSPRVVTRQAPPQQQQGGWFSNWGWGGQQQQQQRQYNNSYRQQRAQPGFFPFLFRR